MKITDKLFELQDIKYADFQSKLIPNIQREKVIGVRMPEIRKLAKEIIKDGDYSAFLQELPHKYCDENILHSILLTQIKDYNECIKEVELFLPFVDNWAVCDVLSPKVFKNHKHELFAKITEWIKSSETYTIRFGIGMIMTHFLEENFKPEYLEIPAKIRSEEYYVKMMQAWFFATALAKQWDSTISYIENARLDKWTHNKTIQKAIESYRITDEQKEYLKTLKNKS